MNKKFTKLLSIFLIAGLIGTGAAVEQACSKGGDDQNQEQTDAVTGVTASASATSVAVGGEVTLTADVTGTGSYSTNVTWSITEGASLATLNGNKLTANAVGTVKVQATSESDTTKKSNEVTITITAPQSAATVTSVSVSAAGNVTTVANGGTLQLSATVAGDNNPAQTVTWSIKSGATATGASVDSNGLLTAGTVAGSVTVVATSTVDNSKSGELVITVEAEELDLSIEITGNQTVAQGATLQLTATVSGVPEGGESGVTWSVDDETVATIDENGLLTAVSTGMVTVTATSKLDTTVSADYDIIVTQATLYDSLANRSDNLLAENFSAYTEGQAIADYSSWGTAGVYAKTSTEAEKVTVVGGQAKAYNATKLNNISIMVDFGPVEGVVEGYFEYSFLAAPSSGNGNSINFYNGSAKVLTIMGHASGSVYTIENIPGAAAPTATLTCDTTSTVAVHFSFDLTNKKVTLKLNDETVCDNLACDIDAISGFEVVTSNGGNRGVTLDNVAVCGTELTAATQKTRMAAQIAAYETEYSLTETSYYAALKQAYDTEVESATTVSAVDTAYNTLISSVLTAMKTAAKEYVDGLWSTGYTIDAEKVATVKTGVKESIDAAKNFSAVQALIDADALADALDAAGVHPDTYHNAVDVTVEIYEKGTTTSVVKSDANLTEKDGQSFTVDYIKSMITVPDGKRVKALYTDAAGENEITDAFTLDADGSTSAVTVTIYVEFEEVTAQVWEFNVNNNAPGSYTAGTAMTYGTVNDNPVITIIANSWSTEANSAKNDDWGLGGYKIDGGTNSQTARLFKIDLSETGANIDATETVKITITYSENAAHVAWISTNYGNSIPKEGDEGLIKLGTTSTGYGVTTLTVEVKGGEVYYFCHDGSNLFVKGIKVEYGV